MTTDADITVEGQTAGLAIGGQRLIARILSPAGARFRTESAGQKPPQKTNKGVRRLVIKLQNAEGNVRIAILLSPIFPDNSFVTTVDLKPLTQWQD